MLIEFRKRNRARFPKAKIVVSISIEAKKHSRKYINMLLMMYVLQKDQKM